MASLRKDANWPADKVERWPVAKLAPNARNARTHSDEQVTQLAASIEEWDMERLAIEIAELRASDFDISLIGFSESEIDDLLKADEGGLTDPDEAPEAPVEPVSKLGDVWLLGKHRLVCGDCTDALVVEKAMNGVKPHLMVTDPPYGVEYDAAWRGRRTRAGKRTSLGVHAKGKSENDNRTDWSEAWALFAGSVAYVWCASLHSDDAISSLDRTGFERRSQIIWVK